MDGTGWAPLSSTRILSHPAADQTAEEITLFYRPLRQTLSAWPQSVVLATVNQIKGTAPEI